MSVASIEAGVHLYDSNNDGGIWVYLPIKKEGKYWLTDVLTVFPSGEIRCHTTMHSERYLSSMFEDLYV